jgi:hypothetical protein
MTACSSNRLGERFFPAGAEGSQRVYKGKQFSLYLTFLFIDHTIETLNIDF